MLPGVALLGVLLVLGREALHRGPSWFFRVGDPVFFRAVARAPFGDGSTIRRLGFRLEASYRYGRIGYPIVGWILALGRPAWEPTTLAAYNLLALAAVPVVAIWLLDAYGAPALRGAATAVVPGLFILATRPYADGVLITVLSIGFLLEARGFRRSAMGVLAYAALIKETACIAIAALLIRALWRREWADARGWALALIPYCAWACWVRFRVGEFPFLANDPARRGALAAPFAGIFDALRHGSSYSVPEVTMVLLTIACVGYAAWLARAVPIASAAGAFAVLTICTGSNTIAYFGDTVRVLIAPQVLGIVCAAYAWPRANPPVTNDDAIAAVSG